MNELRALNRRAMGSMNLWLIVLLLSIFFLAAIQECYADSAEVLPQGRSAVFVEGKFYLPVTKQYDEDGNKEKIADKYNATLNSTVLPALGPLGAAFGLPPGSANLGQTDISYKYNFTFMHSSSGSLSMGFLQRSSRSSPGGTRILPLWSFA